MNYDHNKKFGLFKFQSGYRKLILNSPNGYSRKIITAQTGQSDRLRSVTVLPCQWWEGLLLDKTVITHNFQTGRFGRKGL